MTHVKICGITDGSHALAAARAGAHYIGLVFAPSRRRVSIEQASRISQAVKATGLHVHPVGVFTGLDAETVNKIAERCGLDRIQLSGDESWEYARLMNRPVIKAVRVGKGNAHRISEDIFEGARILGPQCIVLLDTEVKGKYGGTGVTFDWHLARQIAQSFKIMVAGGLTPENVGQAIRLARPWGVDVSTGVETKGVKDPDKIVAFIEAVRRADDAQP